jgi:hypothetical protein
MIPNGPWFCGLSQARPDAAGACTGGCGQAGVWGTGGRALVFADGQLAGIVALADISRALERISGNRAGRSLTTSCDYIHTRLPRWR